MSQNEGQCVKCVLDKIHCCKKRGRGTSCIGKEDYFTGIEMVNMER